MALELRPLSPEDIAGNADAFLGIAADVPGEYWTIEHFLRDLPGKWDLSIAAWSDAKPVAYAIVSRKAPGLAHIHHFMVSGVFRGQGLGTRMAQEIEARALRGGCDRIGLKVAVDNAGARRFYERLGYARTAKEGGYFTYEKRPYMTGAPARGPVAPRRSG